MSHFSSSDRATPHAVTARPLRARGDAALDGRTSPRALGVYGVVGTLFGVVFTKAEVISWFRIQEMFRFQSFHMYGIIGSAVAVAALSVFLMKRWRLQTLAGEDVVIPQKALGRGTRYWLGGTLFGLGWALTGACPGPLFALIGAGNGAIVIVLLSAIAGTWLYGALRPRLPH